jgi:hypothetical protein
MLPGTLSNSSPSWSKVTSEAHGSQGRLKFQELPEENKPTGARSSEPPLDAVNAVVEKIVLGWPHFTLSGFSLAAQRLP